jgi:hypothetical protein
MGCGYSAIFGGFKIKWTWKKYLPRRYIHNYFFTGIAAICAALFLEKGSIR